MEKNKDWVREFIYSEAIAYIDASVHDIGFSDRAMNEIRKNIGDIESHIKSRDRSFDAQPHIPIMLDYHKTAAAIAVLILKFRPLVLINQAYDKRLGAFINSELAVRVACSIILSSRCLICASEYDRTHGVSYKDSILLKVKNYYRGNMPLPAHINDKEPSVFDSLIIYLYLYDECITNTWQKQMTNKAVWLPAYLFFLIDAYSKDIVETKVNEIIQEHIQGQGFSS